jgi:hypothetical protein
MVARILCASAIAFVCAIVSAAPEDELPDGEGKRILMASCAGCHELDEVTKFRGYYTKEQWRDIVVTMVEYGATMKKGEDEVLVDYLTQHLGKKNEIARDVRDVTNAERSERSELSEALR